MKPRPNELIEIINKPIGIIDYQVKEYEDNQRTQKIAEINRIYDSLIGDLQEDISLDSIYNDKWENIGTTLPSIEKGNYLKVKKSTKQFVIIKGMASDKSESALDNYFNDLDLPRAISDINKYEARKKKSKHD